MATHKKRGTQTKHHIISRCKGNQYNVHHHINIKRISDKRHVALHSLFRTHEPKKQLKEYLTIIESTLSEEAKRKFKQLLAMEDFYRDELYL